MSEKVNVSESGEFKQMNTRRLQIFELGNYMVLEHGAIFDGVGFTNVNNGDQFSFEQAVKLFNERDLDYTEGLIERVKLRYSKRDKKIICTNHDVKLVPEFAEVCADDGVATDKALKAVMNRFRLR